MLSKAAAGRLFLVLLVCVAVPVSRFAHAAEPKKPRSTGKPAAKAPGKPAEKPNAPAWPELTDAEEKAALAAHKEFLERVASRFAPLTMQTRETRYFLLLSALPPQHTAMVASHLDAAHAQLCKAFGIKNGDKVWRGKCPVVVFLRPDYFAEFEREFFQRTDIPPQVQGLAHQDSRGDVVVSCYCGADPAYFAGVLVHEMTHGFTHRYKSPERLPAWLDEGIADWSAMAAVPVNKAARGRVRDAVLMARKTRSLGGDFFTSPRISGLQYGIAAGMVDFMLRSNPKAFGTMIDGIKSGEAWEDALKQSYGVTPPELAARYGMSVGIVGLSP
jgi:hypothetical protein